LTFEADASNVAVFRDDRGNDLLKQFSQSLSSNFSLFSTISDDGKTAAIDVRVGALPTPGAREIHLEGKLVFKCAGEQANVGGSLQLETGVRAQVGPVAVLVKEVEPERPEKAHLEPTHKMVHLVTEGQDPDTIETLQLLDASGEPISVYHERGMHRSNYRTVGKFNFNIPLTVQFATLQIRYWKDSALVEVPVNVTLSAGL
jgi:hypothetical protein